MATGLDIEGGRPLAGHVTAPPDKSIAHRALILAALGCIAAVVRLQRDVPTTQAD
jgi:5-enolpyruvylshikimate-3-phosphate synthase